jgi:parallel beta-helix repeat protein
MGCLSKNKNLTLLLILIFQSIYCHSQIVINEFSASNATQIEDADYADYSDWIELYNAGSSSVSLKGYYLTDNLGNPDKWQITESISITAGGYLLIWADGNDSGLHTSFKLSADGEEIGLYNSNLVIQDSVVYSEQKSDVSCGRKTNGSSDWGYFTTATPGSSNNTKVYTYLDCNVPEFSVKGGFYTSTINVELSSYLGGEIYYTLDGSEPELTSTKYTQAIAISSTTILRARIFKSDHVPGDVSTSSYFINENSVNAALPVVSIASNPDNFWDSKIGIYVQDYKPDWEVPINIELFENNGSDRAAFNELAGCKVNGLNSWELPQKMLGIYFRKQYGSSSLSYSLINQRNRSSHKDFALRASGNDWSNTMFRDILGQQATLLNMNLDIIGFKPSIVYVNGQYMGIHNIREKVDEDYIVSSYNIDEDSFDMVENETYAENGDLTAYNQLLTLLNKGLSSDANYNAVADIMNIENFTDYVITEMCVGNFSIDHNVMAWKPKDSGKWEWIVTDLDRGFTSASKYLISFYTGESVLPLKQLMNNAGYKAYFGKRLAAQLYTSFHPDRMNELIAERKAAIAAEMPNHIARWKGTTSGYGDAIPSYTYWETEVQKLATYVEARPAVLLKDLQNYGFSATSTLTLSTYPENVGSMKIEGLKIPATEWSGPYLKNLETTLSAEYVPGYTFIGWTTESTQSTTFPNTTSYLTTSKDYNLTLTKDTHLFAVYNATGQCLIPEIISGDLTLDIECSPYLASGNITIQSGATLTIDAGVEIWMPEDASITINGVMNANGTANKGITFKLNPNVDQTQWGILFFKNTDSTSTLKHVTVEGASTGPDLAIEIATITAFNADLVLDHMTMENNYGCPIMARYSDVTLTNSKLHSDVTGDNINVKYGHGYIANCVFTGNDVADADAIDYDEVENGVVRNCIISDFNGYNSDAFDIGEKASNILIDSVTVCNITDKGVSLGQQTSGTVQNCVFINCTKGIGVKDSSNVTVNNCVFYGNVDAVACYEKNLGYAGGNAVITNSILSNSSDSAFYIDSKSTLKSNYCLTDELEDNESTTNTIGNPLFESPSYNNFNLLSGSPAIDAGWYNGASTNIGTLTDASFFEPRVMIYQFFVNGDNLDLPEYIALYNPSSYSIDISNYAITKGVTATIPENTYLDSGEILYVTDYATANSWWLTTNQLIEWEDGKLSNNGETIQLENSFGQVVDFLTYNEASWPAEGFSGTNAFELIRPNLDNHFAESWETTSVSEIMDTTEAISGNSFTMYPNPTNGVVIIKALSYENSVVKVYSCTGQLVTSTQLDNVGLGMLDLTEFLNGIYIIKIQEKAKKILLIN